MRIAMNDPDLNHPRFGVPIPVRFIPNSLTSPLSDPLLKVSPTRGLLNQTQPTKPQKAKMLRG